MIYSRRNNATTIILINDDCTIVTSIKDDEHERQTATHTSLPNVYPKESEQFPTPTQLQTNHVEIGKQTPITEAFKASIQSNCSCVTSYINLLLPRISLVEDRRITLLSSKLKLTR